MAPTEIGERILSLDGWDPYLEDPASVWVLHWLMLAPPCLLPVWWLAFNEFHAIEIAEEELERVISTQLKFASDWQKPSTSSIRKDVRALLRTYAPVAAADLVKIDDRFNCPFRDIGIMTRARGSSRYRFVSGAKPTLPSAVVAFAALDFVERTNPGTSTVTVSHLAHVPGGPGRVFKLSEGDLLLALTSFIAKSKRIELVSLAGASQVTWSDRPGEIAHSILDDYYAESFDPVSASGGRQLSCVLADHVAISGRFARSANVERDCGRREPLDGYVVTPRIVDVLQRVVSTARLGKAGGAWSLTGPYGSGKSSLALLINAVFGPDSPMRDLAMRLVAEASKELEDAMMAVHARHCTNDSGFYRGLVTAGGEPLSVTIFRALQAAVNNSPRPTELLAKELEGGGITDVLSTDPYLQDFPPSQLVRIARVLAEDAPLFIIIDEFGKSLETVGKHDEGTYLLQQLAEAGQGAGFPIFLLTLQHLSFEEYLDGSAAVTRREWAKVQGRFEDIAFVESAEQIRSLIGSVFEPKGDIIRGRIAHWATFYAGKMRGIGIDDLAEPDAVADCYPLHPLTAATLPDLCNRFGQHERTLFSFLTGQNPSSAARFLAETRIDSDSLLPSVELENIYDYFVGQRVLAGLSGREASRWSEIGTRIRDAKGLTDQQVGMAKRIAILNLVSTAGVLRASRHLLSLTDPHAMQVLSALEEAGVVTYRRFADEYRVWQGSDVNLSLLIDSARARSRRLSLAEVMSELDDPAPVIAARHSAEQDVLRVFRRRYVNAAKAVQPVDAFSEFDGEALLVVEALDTFPLAADRVDSAKPIVVVVPRDLDNLEEAAREVLAILSTAEEPIVVADWVARGECAERLAHAKATLDHEVQATFRPDACRWFLLGTNSEDTVELPVGRGSQALSKAADTAYKSTPRVGNEVLNRSHLTTQGAKARNLLLTAMLSREKDPDLGLEGYGPEVAMYRAFLLRSGIHRKDGTSGQMVFGAPPTESSLRPAWDIVEKHFGRAKVRRLKLKTIYAALQSRPVGMKAGVIPVLLTAILLARRDEIAIYEHGTFRPQLAAEVSERMVRNPHHFDIKHFANKAGVRRDVVTALAKRLNVRPILHQFRVANVLGVAGHLVSMVRRLDNFALRTLTMSSDTLAVRAAILEAVEPDELIFHHLPAALSLPAVLADAARYPESNVYAERLGATVEELSTRYDALGNELLEALLRLTGENTRQDVNRQAVALDQTVLDDSVRAFVLALQGDATMSDKEWIIRVATVVSKKAPTEWTDQDLSWFKSVLGTHIGAFQRLVALHANGEAWDGTLNRAFSVIFSEPSGKEHYRLISVDDEERSIVERELSRLLQRIENDLGSRRQAERALLALIGERCINEAN